MKDWIQQRSTWIGFGAILIAVLSTLTAEGKIDDIYLTVASAALGAIGLGVKDKRL